MARTSYRRPRSPSARWAGRLCVPCTPSRTRLQDTRKLGSSELSELKLTFALSDTAKVARVTEHVVQGDFGDGSKFVLTDFTVHDRTTTLVDTTNYSTYQAYQYMFSTQDDKHELWNSEGATTSTVMIGSRIVGPALATASRNAPMAARRKANSDESTACARPSFRTKRTPQTWFPDSEPFSQAS